MNTSAKLTAASFLAALALGAAAFTGCTVTSSTNTDTDASPNNNNNNNDGGSSNGDSGTGNTGDSSTPVTTTCESTESLFIEQACQTCMDTKCCSEMQACFAIQPDPPEKPYGCKAYADEIETCKADPATEQQCYSDADAVAADGVPAALESISTCQQTNCKTECGL